MPWRPGALRHPQVLRIERPCGFAPPHRPGEARLPSVAPSAPRPRERRRRGAGAAPAAPARGKR